VTRVAEVGHMGHIENVAASKSFFEDVIKSFTIKNGYN